MCEYRGPLCIESPPPLPDIGGPDVPGPMAPGRALPTGQTRLSDRALVALGHGHGTQGMGHEA